jgi:hypothetical protein
MYYSKRKSYYTLYETHDGKSPGTKGLFMSRRLQIVLIITGLIIICGSLIMIGFSLYPAETMRAQATLAPTVFIEP